MTGTGQKQQHQRCRSKIYTWALARKKISGRKQMSFKQFTEGRNRGTEFHIEGAEKEKDLCPKEDLMLGTVRRH